MKRSTKLMATAINHLKKSKMNTLLPIYLIHGSDMRGSSDTQEISSTCSVNAKYILKNSRSSGQTPLSVRSGHPTLMMADQKGKEHMSKNTLKILNVGMQIDGYTVYIAYANQLAVGRALSPDMEKQYAIIANKRYAYKIDEDEWFVATTYVDQHTAEKNFADKCFSWINIPSEELYNTELLTDDEEIYESKLSKRYFSSEDERKKMNTAMEKNKEIRDSIRHPDEA